MKLNRSLDNLSKKLERLDLHPLPPHVPSSNNKTGLSHWKGKPIIDGRGDSDLQNRSKYMVIIKNVLMSMKVLEATSIPQKAIEY
ncbi:MAG: hypothetical protein WA941_17510 [Nitrososphaeraceae archaeon]